MRYIDQEKIYEATDAGLDVFKHYFTGEDITNPKHFIKVRPEEKTASARVSWFQNYWRITDFGNQDQVNSMKAIDFVMYREGLPYYDALLFIEQVILRREMSGTFQKSRFAADVEWREVTRDDKKGSFKFVYKKKPDTDDLAAIGRYVDEETLDRYNCKAVEKFEMVVFSKKQNKDVVKIVKSHKDYPIFVFDYGKFRKIYQPHNLDKRYRFMYDGEKPTKYVFGLEQIRKAKSEFVTDAEDPEAEKKPEYKPDAIVRDIFRCSGESDALNLASMGFHVYWLNSESADLNQATFQEIDDLCENHYQIMDLDFTGRQQAFKNALKHINQFTIQLPENLSYKNDWRGNPCKDLKDFINIYGDTRDETIRDFISLKSAACKAKFWVKIKSNRGVNYEIDLQNYFFFLKANGFYQTDSTYHKNAGYCYVKIDGKVVELIHPDDFKRRAKRFTMDWVRSKKLNDVNPILNKIVGSAQLSEDKLDSIDEITLNFKNYDRNTEYLHFLNRSLQITAGEIKSVVHSQVPNFILGNLTVNNKHISHQIQRNIRLLEKPIIDVQPTEKYKVLKDRYEAASTDDERRDIDSLINQVPETERYQLTIHDSDFIFIKFLRNLSRIHWRKEIERGEKLTAEEQREQDLTFLNLCFVLGFHASQYKDPAKPWLTFLQDNKISDIGEASGRSGKSLFSQAATYLRASFYRSGRTLNDKNQYQFFYDGLTEFHDYIEVDDLHEYADFSFFYTQVTGKREVNPKNYTAITLDYEDSGKMLISSNYELQNVNASTIARLLSAQVSDYYHEKTKYNDYLETRSPLLEFGKLMYDEFTDDEWNRFYNFAAYCIQLTQRFHKINPPVGNLEKRQLRRMMAQGLGKEEEFLRWANDYFILNPHGQTEEISPEENGYFNHLVNKETAFKQFQSILTRKQESEYKIGKFKKHLEHWCEYHGYILNPEDVCTDVTNRRILRYSDGKTTEFIYIRKEISGYTVPIITDKEKLPF